MKAPTVLVWTARSPAIELAAANKFDPICGDACNATGTIRPPPNATSSARLGVKVALPKGRPVFRTENALQNDAQRRPEPGHHARSTPTPDHNAWHATGKTPPRIDTEYLVPGPRARDGDRFPYVER